VGEQQGEEAPGRGCQGCGGHYITGVFAAGRRRRGAGQAYSSAALRHLAVSRACRTSSGRGLNTPLDCHTIDINEWRLADAGAPHFDINLEIQLLEDAH